MSLPGFIIVSYYNRPGPVDAMPKHKFAEGFLDPITKAHRDSSIIMSACFDEIRDHCVEAGFERFGGLNCTVVAAHFCRG